MKKKRKIWKSVNECPGKCLKEGMQEETRGGIRRDKGKLTKEDKKEDTKD